MVMIHGCLALFSGLLAFLKYANQVLDDKMKLNYDFKTVPLDLSSANHIAFAFEKTQIQKNNKTLW